MYILITAVKINCMVILFGNDASGYETDTEKFKFVIDSHGGYLYKS